LPQGGFRAYGFQKKGERPQKKGEKRGGAIPRKKEGAF